MTDSGRLARLEAKIQALNDAHESVATTLGLAVQVLISTHPNPGAFAKEFQDMHETVVYPSGKGRAQELGDTLAAGLYSLAKQLAAIDKSAP